MSAAAAGGGAAAAAAAAHKRRMDEEEEALTTYNQNDMDGWEFKILRSSTGRFGNYQTVQQVCEEESRAGWEMVEKFDNNRIRFKRRIDHRSRDAHRELDPYRSSIGMSAGGTTGLIIGILVALLGVGLLVFLKTGGGGIETTIILPLVVVAVIIVLIVVRLRKGKSSRRYSGQ